MRTNYITLLCVAILFATMGVSQNNTTNDQKRVVDFKADIMKPVKFNDTSALNLIGNVVFYHNGAIITCDSAVRFSDKHMECYKNVVVNKDSTYVYGDRADYNGELNIANIYAPIIKMVDGSAVLYTYTFSFNTLTNIGEFSGGATMRQDSNILESERGYYYADNSVVVCVGSVEMENPQYKMNSDSISYNLNTNVASFFTKSHIWSDKGEILSANRGSYDQPKAYYRFTSDSYVLTKDKELWCDTLDYRSISEVANLYGNIQLNDTDNDMIVFGDRVDYWGQKGKVLMSKKPVILNIAPDQPDTLYFRADTILMQTFSRDTVLHMEKKSDEAIEEEMIEEQPVTGSEVGAAMDSLGVEAVEQKTTVEEVVTAEGIGAQESLDTDSEQLPPMTRKQKRQLKKSQKKAKSALNDAKKGDLNSVVTMTDSMKRADTLTNKGVVVDSKLVKGSAEIIEKSVISKVDPEIDTLVKITPERSGDSIQRLIQAYRNVKVYRSDLQMVCDSMVSFSIDTTTHLYNDPIMWNSSNQITAEVIDIFTKNENLDRVLFSGNPIMSSEIDTASYNQVKGKAIETLFENNEVYQNKVLGNGQTLYYMQDEKTKVITGLFSVECSNITFEIDSNTVMKINYIGDPKYSIYPFDMIPEDQPRFLPDFKWEIKRQPTKKEIFNGVIKPSVREKYEQMPQPLFPISESIYNNMKDLISNEMWLDRTDTVSQEVLNYIESLGYQRDISNKVE